MIPQSLPDLLTILRRRPDCIIWAGGTWLGTSSLGLLEMERHDIIGLGKIEELGRIYRTDRFTDIGCLCTLERLLRLDPKIIPPGLQQAILATVPAPTRSLATIGGNLCLPARKLSLLPWMAAADARLELRRQGSVRHVTAGRFLGHDGEPSLLPGELLTRIRIPLGRWNHESFRRMEADPDTGHPLVAFVGFASIQKDRLEESRILVAFSNREHIVFTNPDAELTGLKLPLSERVVQLYLQQASQILQERMSELSAVATHRILMGMTSYLYNLRARED